MTRVKHGEVQRWWLIYVIVAAHSALLSGYCTHLLAGGTP